MYFLDERTFIPSRKRSRSEDENLPHRAWKNESLNRFSKPANREYSRYSPRASGSSTRAADEHTPVHGHDKPNQRPRLEAPKKSKDFRGRMNFDEEVLVRKKDDDEVSSLREELKYKRRELEWKVEEISEKRKEILNQQVLINTLKNKKEKQGTLNINEALNKKNVL